MDLLEPGVEIRPKISQAEAVGLVEKLYGFKVGQVSQLNGYDDVNYRVEDAQTGRVFVLKILNSLDSKKIDFVRAQNQVLLHLNEKGVNCPKPMESLDKEDFALVDLSSGKHVVRLLSFLHGKILHEVQTTGRMFYEAGQFIAKLDKLLESFHHKAYDTHKTLWMLDAVPQLRPFLSAVVDPLRRDAFAASIRDFEARVVGQPLPRGLIHGDFNEQNVVVAPSESGLWTISGLLDFGDSHFAPYLFELAIAMTYMMIVAGRVEAGGHVLAGYLAVKAMSDKELDLLKVCIMARLTQSLVMSSYTSLRDPGNAYVSVSAIAAWELFQTLRNIPESELLAVWRRTCATYQPSQ